MSAATEIADWENRQLNAAMGGATMVRIATGGIQEERLVLKGSGDHGTLFTTKPVIDREIDEV